jgi:hypothetical protein
MPQRRCTLGETLYPAAEGTFRYAPALQSNN